MLKNMFGFRTDFGKYNQFVDSFVFETERLKAEYARIVNRNGVKSTNIFKSKKYLGKFLICIFIILLLPIVGLIDIVVSWQNLSALFIISWSLVFALCFSIGLTLLFRLCRSWVSDKKTFEKDSKRVNESYLYAVESMEYAIDAFFKGDKDFEYPDLKDKEQGSVDSIFNGLEELEFDLVEPQRICYKNKNLFELPKDEEKDKNKAKQELKFYMLKSKQILAN